MLALISVTSIFTCGRNDLGDRLFDVVYEPVFFDVRAGVPGFQTDVIAINRLPTGFGEALTENGLDEEDVDFVSGLRARISSLSGEDFGEIESIELRLCPVGQANGCDRFDLLFVQRDISGRRDLAVDLNPGERNFRDLLLSNEDVRLEIVITPFSVTSQNIQARLDWSVAALGNL